MNRSLIIVLMLMLMHSLVSAQFAFASLNDYQHPEREESSTPLITLKLNNATIGRAISLIERQSGLGFIYMNNEIDVNKRFSITVKDQPVTEVVERIFGPLGIRYEFVNNKIILRQKRNGRLSGIESTQPLQDANTGTFSASIPSFPVSGVVTDPDGNPVSGATVMVRGTNLGTATDEKGAFSISVPDEQAGGRIDVSAVGYGPQSAMIIRGQSITIVLSPTQSQLDEVVVVGYGTQRRVSVSGAVESINAADLEGRPVPNMSLALQGAAANLIVQQNNFEPGQTPSINIRGISTLGSNAPLVVIDGLVSDQYSLNLLNPNDVESISVLKDAGTAAIYGSRSANGVILVTTKTGKRNQTGQLRYSGTYGIQSPTFTYKPVDAWENAYYKNISLVNSGLAPAFTPEQIRQFHDAGNGDWWVGNIMQNAPQQSHTVSFSGGSNSNTYYISLGYMNQASNFEGRNYGYSRYNARLNQTMQAGKLKFTTLLNYAKVINKDHAFNSGFLIVDASRVPLYYSFKDTLGRYLTNPVSAELNPLAILNEGGYRKFNDDELLANFTAEYPLTEALKFKANAGGTMNSFMNYEKANPVRFYPGGQFGVDSRVTDRSAKNLLYNLQALLDYNQTFSNSHNVSGLLGTSYEDFHHEGFGLSKQYTDPVLGIPISGTVIDPNSMNSVNDTYEWRLLSYFGRVGYDFEEKYYVQFNMRADASSRFTEANRWGYFPSGSVAWVISKEPFFEELSKTIPLLKLRASYGILGNQNVGAYQYQTTFFNYTNAYAFNNVPVGGSGFTFGNPLLTWEKAETANLGIDMTLLRRRLDFSFDVFNKVNRDILAPRFDVLAIFGAGVSDFNVATVQNRGWEAKLVYRHPGKLFNHTLNLNVADNLNKVIDLGPDATGFSLPKEEFEIVRKIGQPITVYQGYKTNGYFQNQEDIENYPNFAGRTVTPGDVKFVDRNGDKIIDDNDKFILGNPFPRYTFGLNYVVEVAGFDLNLFIQGVGKRAQMVRGEQVEPFHFGYGGTMYAHQTDFWTPTNPNARWPKLAEAGSASNLNNYRTGSDLYLFNAAYARLKNVQLGYTLPQSVVNRLKMGKARVYLTGQNLFTLTELDFIDPELSEFNSDLNVGAGANSARAYFMPRFFGVGLDITFK